MFTFVLSEVDLVKLDDEAGIASASAEEGADVKVLPEVATLNDLGRLDASKALIAGIDGLRSWTFAHQAAPSPALDGLDFDMGVEFARASSAARALRDKVFANYIGSCNSLVDVVNRDVATKESLNDAQFIADSPKGKKLRMDLVAKETNQHLVRRLNFLAKTRDVITSFKDD